MEDIYITGRIGKFKNVKANQKLCTSCSFISALALPSPEPHERAARSQTGRESSK